MNYTLEDFNLTNLGILSLSKVLERHKDLKDELYSLLSNSTNRGRSYKGYRVRICVLF